MMNLFLSQHRRKNTTLSLQIIHFEIFFLGITLLEYGSIPFINLRFPVFYVIFPSDLSKFSVRNLPMVPLDPWKAPERTNKEAQEPSEKRAKIEESSVC